jgi:hypothetical protein
MLKKTVDKDVQELCIIELMQLQSKLTTEPPNSTPPDAEAAVLIAIQQFKNKFKFI